MKSYTTPGVPGRASHERQSQRHGLFAWCRLRVVVSGQLPQTRSCVRVPSTLPSYRLLYSRAFWHCVTSSWPLIAAFIDPCMPRAKSYVKVAQVVHVLQYQ